MTAPHERAFPLRVVLKRGRSKPFWVGHPWVFSGAIHRVEGPVGDTGGPCLVIDERGNVLGSGFYNPNGRIAVRITMHRRTTDRDFQPRPLADVLGPRLRAAIGRRRALGLPNAETDAYRLVNAEGDLLPGLIVDRIGNAAVAQIGSRAIYEQRDAVVAQLFEQLDVDRVVAGVTETASKLEGIPVEKSTHGRGGGAAPSGPAFVTENGLRYQIALDSAQKTGFFADQRENRRRFGRLCADQRVLDAYCYHGGFGLNAARAGASSVMQVDSSAPAVAAARANAALNGLGDTTNQLQGDAMTFLKEASARGERWDRIICDPPKFARGRSHLADALKKYTKLNTLALGVLSESGLMLTCSCSRHVSEQAFARMLNEAGHRLRKTVIVHEVWGQPADHPSTAVAPEGRYLKAYLVSVS